MNSTLNVADMVPDDGEFVPDFRPRTTAGSATNEQRTMTRDEQDDYLLAHFGVDQTQGQICAATGIPTGSITGRIKSLREAGRIPADRQSLGRQGWRDNPEQPEQKASEPVHECPPHHWLEGDGAILRVLPNFYKYHADPRPGEQWRACLYCTEVEIMSNGVRSDTKIAEVIAEEQAQRRRQRLDEIVAERSSGFKPQFIPIQMRQDAAVVMGEVALAPTSLPVEYDGDSGDEHHDRPLPLHHVDIPEEVGAPLLEAGDVEETAQRVMIIPTPNNPLTSEVRLSVDGAGNVSPMVSPKVADLLADLESEADLANIAEETGTALTPYGMALQEIARLRSDLARTEGELRGAYDHTRLLTARLEQTEKNLHQARMQLLLPDLIKRREDLRQTLADISVEIEEIEAELGVEAA